MTWGRTEERSLGNTERNHNKLGKAPKLKSVGIQDDTQEKYQIRLSCPLLLLEAKRAGSKRLREISPCSDKVWPFYVLFTRVTVCLYQYFDSLINSLCNRYMEKTPLQGKVNDKSFAAGKSGLRRLEKYYHSKTFLVSQ